jgi:hypothetical protein
LTAKYFLQRTQVTGNPVRVVLGQASQVSRHFLKRLRIGEVSTKRFPRPVKCILVFQLSHPPPQRLWNFSHVNYLS